MLLQLARGKRDRRFVPAALVATCDNGVIPARGRGKDRFLYSRTFRGSLHAQRRRYNVCENAQKRTFFICVSQSLIYPRVLFFFSILFFSFFFSLFSTSSHSNASSIDSSSPFILSSKNKVRQKKQKKKQNRNKKHV